MAFSVNFQLPNELNKSWKIIYLQSYFKIAIWWQKLSGFLRNCMKTSADRFIFEVNVVCRFQNRIYCFCYEQKQHFIYTYEEMGTTTYE